MTSQYNTWYHPYEPDEKYSKKAAYFSMEFGIHQSLKIYSGGLGFLAGSHMLSAFELKQNMIGVGMLWKYGYYDQGRNKDQTLRIDHIEKYYNFLEDTGIEVTVHLNDNPNVKVRAYVLKPEVFGSVPIYLLSTDVPGNDHVSRTITDHLYDGNTSTRIAQNIVLGIGGAKVVQQLGGADMYHLNEGHALPAFYHLRDSGVKKEQMYFTTHTPEKAGNVDRDINLLNGFGFFGRKLSEDEMKKETIPGNLLSYTVAALRMANNANAVSKLHSKVAKDMWAEYAGISEIIPITNSQNQKFWQDDILQKGWESRNEKAFHKRKLELKSILFEEVLEQTGKIFDPNTLTIVWARRFAEYKRADLILKDLARFEKIFRSTDQPVQIIWAGKPYPTDQFAIDLFNHLIRYTKVKPNMAVLMGYEMELSRKLKAGSDVWLNTPRITREASGTSGMTAAMNGSINLSINDGWIPEFAIEGENSFVLPEADHQTPNNEQDQFDSENLYQVLEDSVIPTFYKDPQKWQQMVFKAIDGVIPAFESGRMADEYYKILYKQ